MVSGLKYPPLLSRDAADNFHDTMNCFLFSADCANATVSTNSKQVDLPHSRGVNKFYFSGLSFRDTQRI